ncbi:hypothetical protein A6A04_13295 [Paramagnetospirillum marisnigri]|uniref:Ribosome modulation factor n=1 Tax=Paramagnetospirillum marisnigri TaxID=1285242 RepID=A0A178MX23_9PROT|nr:hypothetical protein [Paramagnetospirillum marisnigri]OAN53862.1 hypothetical protein A6A04_13295 [Paramagnetospirillum marisnigri]
MSMVSDEWKDGIEAARCGHSSEACPHPFGTRAANDWSRGWRMDAKPCVTTYPGPDAQQEAQP